MNTKNSIVTYALVGLAAGTVAWLLLGTKEGRKQVDRASDGIRELSKVIRETTKESIQKASQITNRATEEVDALRAQVRTSVDKARRTVKAAVRKAEEEI